MRQPRRRERKPAHLLIAPRAHRAPANDTPPGTIDWCLAGDSPRSLGPDSAPEAWQTLARLAATHPATLLLPANAVSHFHLAAPRGIKRSEWPLLLEEVTSEAVEELHLHPLQRGRDHLELISLPASELAAWQAWAQRLGLRLAGWSSAFLALPTPASNTVSMLDDGDHHLLKGLGAPPVSGAPAANQWLAWPRDWPLPPAWRERPTQDPSGSDALEAGPARARSLAWLATHLPPTLPFAVERRPRWRLADLLPSRRVRFLGGAIGGLAALNVALWLVTQTVDHGQRDAQRDRALAARFIGAPPADALATLAARKAAIDALIQRNQRLSARLARAAGLLDDGRWHLSRLDVAGQEVKLGWRYPEPPAPVVIAQARERLSPLGAPQWEAARGELTLAFFLDAAEVPTS